MAREGQQEYYEVIQLITNNTTLSNLPWLLQMPTKYVQSPLLLTELQKAYNLAKLSIHKPHRHCLQGLAKKSLLLEYLLIQAFQIRQVCPFLMPKL